MKSAMPNCQLMNVTIALLGGNAEVGNHSSAISIAHPIHFFYFYFFIAPFFDKFSHDWVVTADSGCAGIQKTGC